MSDLILYAVGKTTVFPLPISPSAKTINDMYHGLPLGVYSAFRSYEFNKFLGLSAHIARTKQSIKLLNWAYSLDEERLRQSLHEIMSQYPQPNARVRFDVLAEPIEVAGETTRLLIGASSFAGIPEQYYTDGVKVGFAETLNRESPLVKTAVFVSEREKFPIGTAENYERLLINEAGDILECTSANFFAVQQGTIYTANDGVLEGITRKIILQLIEALNMPLILQAPNVKNIADFEEAGLSSSSRAIIPVVQIGSQVIGNGRPGPIMQKLLRSYQAYVSREIRTAV